MTIQLPFKDEKGGSGLGLAPLLVGNIARSSKIGPRLVGGTDQEPQYDLVRGAARGADGDSVRRRAAAAQAACE
ncbi:MAG: hypothetical protein K8F57_06130, partial [Alphaproteobacteria bacterium]|nr:hypothetical protein [Alphaproteobacteria bacterium]